jgi:selenocysteine lyase/cysteine desulfurase
MLSATGRKFLRGPRGTGFLYVDREIIDSLVPPLLDLHAARWISPDEYEIRGDARRFENWETNYASKIGLGAAIEYALRWDLDRIEARVFSLAAELRARLEKAPKVTVRDLGLTRCGIVSFTIDGQDPEAVRDALGRANINVSVSPANFTLLDMADRRLDGGVVRASVHYYNSEEEVDRFCRTLGSIS